MRDKIKIIFIPTVLSLIGLLVACSVLHWALFVEWKVLHANKLISNFGIPVALAATVAWFFLRPRLKILDLESEPRSWKEFYFVMLMIILVVPLNLAQEYITTASAKLTRLQSISEIDDHPPTAYYTVARLHIDKNRIGAYSTSSVSGRHGSDLTMQIYFALPILDNSRSKNCSAWLGIKYEKTISNDLSDEAKERQYQAFASECQRELYRTDVHWFKCLRRVVNSEDFMEAVRNNSAFEPNDTILVAERKPFEARNEGKLFWLVTSMLIGCVVWLIMVAIPPVNPKQVASFRR